MSMLKSLQHLRGVVTLFHDPKIVKSAELLKYIKKTYPDLPSQPFDLEVNEGNPTKEQLVVLKELAPKYAKEIDETKNIPRPTLVDWFDGKIAVDDVSVAEKILAELKKKGDN